MADIITWAVDILESGLESDPEVRQTLHKIIDLLTEEIRQRSKE